MNFVRLHTEEEVRNYIRSIRSVASIDTETTDKDPRKARLIDVQIGKSSEDIVCFEAFYARILLELDRDVVLVAQNYAYDAHVLYRHGVDLRERAWLDTMLLHHLVDENAGHSLDENVRRLWGDDYKEQFWAKYSSYEAAPQEARDEYACKDVYYTAKWSVILRQELEAQAIPVDLETHVQKLAKVLLDTEISGISVDKDYLVEKGTHLKTRVEQLRPQMREMTKDAIDLVETETWVKELDLRKTPRGKAGVKKPEFSFDSSSQVQKLLYGALGLTPQINDKTRQPSVDDASLAKLGDAHPVLPLIREYRGLQKVCSSYIDGTLERMVNGRIYPSFHVNGTVTGRISHSNPNLGNLPSEGGIRGIYVPDPGYSFISADYAQLEVCLAAHFSGDKALLKIINEGASQHDITAEALGVSRDLAKTINFAMQYRCTHYKIAKLLKISEKDGLAVWNKYWATYSGLKRLMDECDYKINNGIPITTLYGRKRRFEVKKRSPWDGAYRQGFNALIQGTGADMTSEALYLVNDKIKGKGRALFSVHDEIIVQVANKDVTYGQECTKETMIGVGLRLNLSVPLKVEVSPGMSRWED